MMMQQNVCALTRTIQKITAHVATIKHQVAEHSEVIEKINQLVVMQVIICGGYVDQNASNSYELCIGNLAMESH